MAFLFASRPGSWKPRFAVQSKRHQFHEPSPLPERAFSHPPEYLIAIFLIDTADLELLTPDASQREHVIKDLRTLGRSVAEAPAAVILQRAQREVEQAEQEALKPTPEMEKLLKAPPGWWRRGRGSRS